MEEFRRHIRNLHDGTPDGQRVFDAVVEGSKVMLEIKSSKREIIRIPWEDVVTQVDIAKKLSSQM